MRSRTLLLAFAALVALASLQPRSWLASAQDPATATSPSPAPAATPTDPAAAGGTTPAAPATPADAGATPSPSPAAAPTTDTTAGAPQPATTPPAEATTPAPADTTAPTPSPAAPAAPAETLQQGSASLAPFYAVRSCLPFAIAVQPPSADAASSGNATLQIVAEPQVINSISVSEADGVLVLSLHDGYATNRTIALTVTATSADALRYVQNFGAGDVIVAPGFAPPDFYAAATGLGSVYAFGLNVTGRTRAGLSGTSTVLLNGTFNTVDVAAGGLSKAYVLNTSGDVVVSTDGISTVWVEGSSGTNITGSADQLAKVLFRGGSCTVAPRLKIFFGLNIFGEPCQKLNDDTPRPSFAPTWTCGQVVQGSSSCAATVAGVPTTIPITTGAAPAPAADATNATTGAGTNDTAAAAGTPAPSSSPTTDASGGIPTTTINVPGGTITTGTFTSGPGASASSSGSVSGTGVPPTTSTQTSEGGAPPQQQATTTTTGGATASAPLAQRQGLLADFPPISFPSIPGLPPSIAVPPASAFPSVFTSATPGSSASASTSATGSPDQSASTQSVDISTPGNLGVAQTSGGLAVVSALCADGAAQPILGAPSG